jgi:hypothetical protein
MLVTLATQEAEIRRIEVQSQPGQIVHKTSGDHSVSYAGAALRGEEHSPWNAVLETAQPPEGNHGNAVTMRMLS